MNTDREPPLFKDDGRVADDLRSLDLLYVDRLVGDRTLLPYED